MSNEPVELEVDCAVAPYSHHHNPHHLPPHQNPHLQHHHNPHLEVASPPHGTDERTSNEDEEGEYFDEVDEDEESIENEEQKVQFECDEGQLDGLTKLVRRVQSYPSENATTNGNLGELTQLENVVEQTGHEHFKKAPKDTHHAELVSPSSSSTSGNSDISESEDDDDDEDADDDSEEEEEEESEEDDDEVGDDDEFDEEIDDDDIVDPVGHQSNGLMQRITVSSHGYDCNGTNMSCYNRIKNNHESTRDEDVSFDHEIDGQAQLHDLSSPVLLDSERMLEVTRKLVRSTERDPDRDLRKQVLLRTAIRKLPQFMEYNYSKSFDQSFQMHNNTLEPNNASLTCMSPAQYYEHNHLSHQIDTQPKSYYHSVQPNAIQMSTTSLRMLDLNDDAESEQTITSLEPKQHQDNGYESHSDLGNSVNQSNLDQRQLEYASHQIYDQHYANLGTQPTSMSQEHNIQGAIHDFSRYDSNHDSNEAMITRHSTIDNLYQPLENSDISDGMKGIEHSAAFESGGNYSRLASESEAVTGKGLLDKSDINDNMINTSAQQIASLLNSEKDDPVKSIHRDISDDSYHQEHDCNQNQTDTTAYHDSNETQQDYTQLADLETPKPISPNHESNLVDTIEALEDQSGCSEGGSSNSSQSSTTSDDSVNSSSSQSNDSAGHLSGISMLETSLNTSDDHRFNYSHDSGVALFSPKSNKRSSSSIGLDDEMEIDHLTDLTSSNQFNSGGTVSTLNQCKRMRKREIMD